MFPQSQVSSLPVFCLQARPNLLPTASCYYALIPTQADSRESIAGFQEQIWGPAMPQGGLGSPNLNQVTGDLAGCFPETAVCFTGVEKEQDLQ